MASAVLHVSMLLDALQGVAQIPVGQGGECKIEVVRGRGDALSQHLSIFLSVSYLRLLGGSGSSRGPGSEGRRQVCVESLTKP